MNKYERLFTWTTIGVLILFLIGTCNHEKGSSDTEKDNQISELQREKDSLTIIVGLKEIRVDSFEVKRDIVKTVYRDRIKYVKSLDSSQHDALFDTLYAGRKDSANVVFYQNEQCQQELAYCDSSSMEKDTIIQAQKEIITVTTEMAVIQEKKAAEEKKKREDDAYKLYLWKNIGRALIATDILVILTVIAIR